MKTGAVAIAWLAGALMLAPALARADEGEAGRPTKDEVRAFLGTTLPARLEEMKRIEKDNPAEAEEMLERWTGWLHEYRNAQAEQPARALSMLRRVQREADADALAAKIRASKDQDEQDRMTPQLRALVEELFAMQMQERADEMNRMEKELQEMKRVAEKRAANKDRIIDRRVRQLLDEGEDEELNW